MIDNNGKLALTGPRANGLASALLEKGRAHENTDVLGADWRAFIRKEFHLSKAQKEHIQNLPTHTVERIQTALNHVSLAGGHLELTLPTESPDGRGKLVIKIGAPTEVQYTVPILFCTFDSNCQNWDCNPLS